MTFDEFTATASVAEIAWTIFGVIGLTVNAGLTWQAWRDYAALIRLGKNGGRKIAARTAIGIQGGLTLVQAVFIAIGVFAMLTPAPVPTRPVTMTALIVTIGLIASEITLVGVGLLTHVGRIRLLSYLDRVEESENAARHAETMTELVHNTEVTTEARDGAVEAYKAANDVNGRIIGVQQDIAETNRIAGESAESLEVYMRKLENERKERDGC